jgi:hypothetical protein
MAERYLIWSNAHRSWWRSGHCGHTGLIARAGRYPRDEAERFCEEANRGLSAYHTPIAVMVLAPEFVTTVIPA